jgi:hypothetical protein
MKHRSKIRVASLALLTLALCQSGAGRAADTVNVFVDQATVTRLPEKVATLVVGNPLIADVSLQSGGLLVVTGKGYGSTNVVALDRAGNVLMEKAVQVYGPRDDIIVVYKGEKRETYSCQPNCERRITLGDTPDFFSQTLAQTGQRNALAVGAQGNR